MPDMSDRACIHTYRQTDIPRQTETDGRTDRHTDRQTETQVHVLSCAFAAKKLP